MNKFTLNKDNFTDGLVLALVIGVAMIIASKITGTPRTTVFTIGTILFLFIPTLYFMFYEKNETMLNEYYARFIVALFITLLGMGTLFIDIDRGLIT